MRWMAVPSTTAHQTTFSQTATADFFPKIRTARVYFRDADTSNVRYARKPSEPGRENDRDRIICALANKAANTHAAIAVLCDSALADDDQTSLRDVPEPNQTLDGRRLICDVC